MLMVQLCVAPVQKSSLVCTSSNNLVLLKLHIRNVSAIELSVQEVYHYSGISMSASFNKPLINTEQK